VSPLWRDEVGIFVAPKRIAIARMKRGVRPANVAERRITVENGDPTQWEPALQALDACLEESVWHTANLRMIIADHWARYSIVPWSDALSDEDERLQHARLIMANTFGDVVSQWTVTLSDAPPGSAQVACAIPTALLDRLRAVTDSCNLRLKSVQPYLIAAFNGWCSKLPRGNAWFVALDEGSLAAAHFSSNQWDYVRSVRIGSDWEVELKRLQTFGRLARTSAEPSPVFVDAPRWLRDKAAGSDHGIEWLNDDAHDGADERFALLQRIYA
jgi:hypothetical protein